jgi:hypothetical protein
MTRRKKKAERTIYRSSVSGRIVTEQYAQAHPETTQRERRAVVRPASRPRTEASA